MAIYPETRVQITILEWLALQHPRARKHVVKIRNEGAYKGGGLYVAIKAGLHIGASDFILAYPLGNFHGAWIEVKPDGYKVTKSNKEHHDNQMEFIELMRSVGFFAEMIIGVDQGIDALKRYFNATTQKDIGF